MLHVICENVDIPKLLVSFHYIKVGSNSCIYNCRMIPSDNSKDLLVNFTVMLKLCTHMESYFVRNLVLKDQELIPIETILFMQSICFIPNTFSNQETIISCASVMQRMRFGIVSSTRCILPRHINKICIVTIDCIRLKTTFSAPKTVAFCIGSTSNAPSLRYCLIHLQYLIPKFENLLVVDSKM